MSSCSVKTIIEPAKPYMKLLGLQKHRAEETYRLMHFVVQTEVDDGLLRCMSTCCSRT